jgi:hypothetical protein
MRPSRLPAGHQEDGFASGNGEDMAAVSFRRGGWAFCSLFEMRRRDSVSAAILLSSLTTEGDKEAGAMIVGILRRITIPCSMSRNLRRTVVRELRFSRKSGFSVSGAPALRISDLYDDIEPTTDLRKVVAFSQTP